MSGRGFVVHRRDTPVSLNPDGSQGGNKTMQAEPAQALVARSNDYFGPAFSTATKSTDMAVSPGFIEFRHVGVGKTYSATLFVKNTAQKPQRIRVVRLHPRSPFNVIPFPTSEAIAPGISAPVEVTFSVPDVSSSPAEQYTEVVEIKGEFGTSLKVPLRAFAPLPALRYPSIINFGTVVAGTSAMKVFDVINASTERGVSLGISLKTELPMTCTPTRALLAPCAETGLTQEKPNRTKVKLTLDAKNLQPGSYRSLVKLDGPGAGSKVIDVLVECVQHGIRLVLPHPGHPAYVRPAGLLHGQGMGPAAAPTGTVLPQLTTPISDSLDMGAVFFGQRASLRALLVNDGPTAVSFSLFTGSQAEAALEEAAAALAAADESMYGEEAGPIGGTPGVHGVNLGANFEGSDDGDEEDGEDGEDGGAFGGAGQGTGDSVLDTAAEKDFHVSPSQGSVPPYGEVLITLSYSARDRRPPPLFRAQAAAVAEETQRALAGMQPSPPKHMPGMGKYPSRGRSNPPGTSGPDTLNGASKEGGPDTGADATGGGRRGRSAGAAVSWRPPKDEHADPRETLTQRAGLSVEEKAELYARQAPLLETFSTRLALLCPERDSTQGVEVTARAVRPSVAVSQAVVDFGQAVPVNGRRDAAISISNTGELLPINWRLGKGTYFFAEPDHGTLDSQGEARVMLSFVPSKLGPANDVLPLIIEPGNGVALLAANPLVITAGDSEPAVRGGRGVKVVHAAAGANTLLALPIAMTAGAVTPGAVGALGATAAALFHRTGMLASRHAGMTTEELAPVRDFSDQESLSHTRMSAMSVAGGHALVACDTNAVEVAEEKQAAGVRKAPGRQEPRPLAWDEVAAVRGLGKPEDYVNEAKYTHTLGGLAARHEEKEKYAKWTQDQAALRAAASVRMDAARHGAKMPGAEVDLDPVNLGIPDGKKEFLKPPALGLPLADNEPLWLARPIGPDGRPQIRASVAAAKLNPDKLVPVKFKASPTTQAEKLECGSELSEDELAAITAGPLNLTLGKLNVLETVSKNFSVFNGLGQCILVELKLPNNCPELALSSPLAQVVPPGALAGFDITFLAQEEQEFRAPITYVINGKHTYRFVATATALPITVQMSRDDLVLTFPEDGDGAFAQYVSDTVEMYNPGRAPAEYTWKAQNSEAPFEIEPTYGVILPGDTASATVTYRPVPSCVTESLFTLNVKGGRVSAPPTLIVQGEVVDAKLTPSVKTADFGTLAVGTRRDVVVSLRNTGSTYAVFYVGEDSLPPYVAVQPLMGRIEPMDAVELTLSIDASASPNPGPFMLDPTQHAVQVSVRGSKGLFIPTAAVVIMPDVVMIEAALSFGSVTLGNKTRKRFTLENRTEIAAELCIDFRKYPRFRLMPPAKAARVDDAASSMSVGEQSQFVMLEGDGEDGNADADGLDERASSPPTRRRPDSSTSSATGMTGGSEEGEEEEDEEDEDEEEAGLSDKPKFLPKKFRVRVNAGAIVPFDVQFKPQDETAFEFQLPVTIKGVEYLEGLDRQVIGRGCRPRLKLEMLVVDFEAKTWYKEVDRRLPYEKKMKLFNADTVPVTWRADTSLLTSYAPASGPDGGSAPAPVTVFSWSPESSTIPVNGSVEVTVTFCPPVPKEYRNTVPLFLDGEESDSGEPYLELELQGTGVAPCLTFDRRELILPPVPIGAVSTGLFTILNNGYDHLPLKWRLPANEISSAVSVPLTVTFPDGEAVSASKRKVRVEVAFNSDKPLAFTVLVEFSDAEGNRFAMPVSGVSEASVLTLEEYWETHVSELYLEAPEGKATTLVSSARPTEATLKAKASLKAKPNAPYSPQFPSKGQLAKAESMIPSTESAMPNLPQALALEDVVWAPKPSSVGRDPRTLVRWINTCLLRSPIAEWPGDVVAANGKQVYDLVEVLSGRPIPGRLPKGGNLPSKKKDRTTALFKQASDFLLHLKTLGAAVHHVRPECLLSLPDFILVRKFGHTGVFTPGQPPFGAPLAKYLSVKDRKSRDAAWVDAYAALSSDAWSTVTWQAIRLFLLSRVTLRALLNTPGMAMDESSKRTWQSVQAAEKEIAGKVDAAKVAAVTARGLTLSPKKVAGETRREVDTTRGRKGKGVAMDETGSLLYDPYAPVPGAEVEPSILLDGTMGGGEGRASRSASASTQNRGTQGAGTSFPVPPMAIPMSPPPKPLGTTAADKALTAKVVDATLLSERTVIEKQATAFLSPDAALTASNAYSVPEGLLLRWLGYHHNRIAPADSARRVIDFVTDLKDGVVLVRTLLSHVPELGLPGRILDPNSGRCHMNPEAPRQERDNATAVVVALMELGLEPPFSPEDLAPEAFAAGDEEGSGDVEGDEFDPMESLNASLAALQMSLVAMSKSKDKADKDAKAANGQAGKDGTGGKGASGSAARAMRPDKPRPSQPLFESGGPLVHSLPGTSRCKLSPVGRPRDFLLWSLWLWQSLPACVPRGLVDFKCALGRASTKHITLTNPTKRAITYAVQLETDAKLPDAGAEAALPLMAGPFSVAVRGITLQPGSTMQLPVKACPLFSKPSHAKLVLRSQREGPVAPSTLVFALRTLVVSRPPVAVKTGRGVTYSPTIIDVDVRNSAAAEASFLITIIPLPSDCPPGANVLPDATERLLSSHPSPFLISGSGADKDPWRLPLHLRPGFVPPTPVVDSSTSAITSMDDETLAMYGLTKADQEAASAEAANATSIALANVSVPLVGAAGTAAAGDAQGAAPPPPPSEPGPDVPDPDLGGLTPLQAEVVGRGQKKSMPTAFWCKWKELSIKAGGIKRLTLQFLPFKPGVHRCAVILVDRASAVGEFVYEVTAEADPPAPTAPKLALRAPIGKTVERLLHVPMINAIRERAWDMSLGRLERGTARPLELAARGADRLKEADTREKAMKGLKEQLKPAPGGKQSSTAAAAQKSALKMAAAALLGSFYDVSVDSPFFETPSRVYIPLPLVALPGSGAGGELGAGSSGDWDAFSSSKGPGKGPGSDAGRSKGGKTKAGQAGSVAGVPTSHSRKGGIAFGAADVAEYDPEHPIMHRDVLEMNCMPSLESAPGPLGPAPGTMTLAALPPSQIEEARSAGGAPAPYKALIMPVAVADALVSGKEEMMQQLSRVPLLLRPKGPGTYPVRVTLTGDRDVRVYEVELTVEAAGPARMVTFATSVGCPIAQALPVSNPTDSDWDLEVQLTSQRKLEEHYFSGPTHLRVPARGSATVNVVWSPEWICDQVVTLTLSPNALQMSTLALQRGGMLPGDASVAPITFDLRGVGEEPLALDTVHLHARVRNKAHATVRLFNCSKVGPVTLSASFSGLQQYVSGVPSIVVPPAKSRDPIDPITGAFRGDTAPGVAQYVLHFNPLTGGTWFGQATFTDPSTGRYQWYAIEAEADVGSPDGRVAVTTAVRHAAGINIELTNSAELPVTLDVTLSGEGLVGEPSFTLAAGSTGVYEALYAPFFPTPGWDARPAPKVSEAAIVFASPTVGEIVYALELVALPGPAHVLPRMSAPIGGSTLSLVTLDNPTAVYAEVRVGVPTNGRIFSVDSSDTTATGGSGQSQVMMRQSMAAGSTALAIARANAPIVIPPFSGRSLGIVYTPASIGQTEEGVVTFSSPTLGDWRFEVSGVGGAPAPSKPMSAVCVVGQVSSHTVTFRNPFPQSIRVDVELMLEEQGEAASQSSPPHIGSAAARAQSARTSATSHTGTHTDRTGAGQSTALERPVAPVLALLKRQHGVLVPPFSSLQIPFAFSPHAIAATKCCVRVHGSVEQAVASLHLVWDFPVHAAGEAPPARKAIKLACAARTGASCPVLLPLPGLDPRLAAHVEEAQHGMTRGGSARGYGAQYKPTGPPDAASAGLTLELVPLPDASKAGSSGGRAFNSSVTAAMMASVHGGNGSSRKTIGAGASAMLAGRSVMGASRIWGMGRPTAGEEGTRGSGSTLDEEAHAEAVERTRAVLDRAVTIHMAKAVLVSTTMEEEEDTVGEGDRPSSTATVPALQLSVDLHPLKAWEGRAELIVRSSTGGRWRFPLRLSFTAAGPDGTLKMEAAVGSTGVYTLPLANAFPVPAQFTARLSLDSPAEFRCTPSGGTLPASNAARAKHGTGMEGGGEATHVDFTIAFTPREHGKQYAGKLFIETESYLWTFLLVGGPNTYVPPVPHGRTEHSLDPRTAASMRAAHEAGRKRNYVAAAGSGVGLLTPNEVFSQAGFALTRGAGPGQYPGSRPASGKIILHVAPVVGMLGLGANSQQGRMPQPSPIRPMGAAPNLK